MNIRKKYHLVSLGCPKNLVDSEVFAGIIQKAGYIYTDEPQQAEVIIINTCGFILSAKQEAIDTILQAAEYKKTGNCKKLIATGCFIHRYLKQLKKELPEIDVLIDLKDFKSFAEIFDLKDYHKRQQLTPAHYAYLRIADGCNNHCSYCAIPSIRGKLQSVPLETLIKQAQEMAAAGVKELIVTAQDTTQYGIDLYNESRLEQLLIELEKIDGLKWIRLLYLHPAHLKNSLIDLVCQSSKICHYFEIPLQHCNDYMLNLMNRNVNKKRIAEIIARIREKDQNAVIRTTLITGHPGETEEMYKELLEFIKKHRFERLGVFTYSEEEGTKSALMKDKVDAETAQYRMDEIMSVQMQISSDLLQHYTDKIIPVIIDGSCEDEDFDFIGRAASDSPEIDGLVYLNGKAAPGQLRQVKITAAWEYDLAGEIID